MRPWPLKPKSITFSWPASLAFFASRMAAAMAWQLSGAGMMPSVWAKVETFQLWDIHAIHVFVFQQLTDDYARAMVAEAARVNVGGLEVMSQGVHG